MSGIAIIVLIAAVFWAVVVLMGIVVIVRELEEIKKVLNIK